MHGYPFHLFENEPFAAFGDEKLAAWMDKINRIRKRIVARRTRQAVHAFFRAYRPGVSPKGTLVDVSGDDWWDAPIALFSGTRAALILYLGQVEDETLAEWDAYAATQPKSLLGLWRQKMAEFDKAYETMAR